MAKSAKPAHSTKASAKAKATTAKSKRAVKAPTASLKPPQ
jgi:hypothetical protein